VPAAAVWQPGIFGLFINVVVWLGLGEFIATVAPFRNGVKRPKLADDYVWRSADRALQIFGTLVSISALVLDGAYYATIMAAFFLLLIIYHLVTVQFEIEHLSLAVLHAMALHVFGFLLIAFTWSYAIVCVFSPQPYTGSMIALGLLASWASDAAGYFFGKRFGRRHLFPLISPTKTLEGTAAQLLFATACCVAFHYAVQKGYVASHLLPIDTSVWLYAAFGLLIGVAGVFGGLVGSVLKRAGGVKDSGLFFAGHGGVSDRFDSHYLCAPATYMVAVLLRAWWTNAHSVALVK